MDISNKELPILGGAGKLTLDLHAGQLLEPLKKSTAPIISLGVAAPPGEALTIGIGDSAKVSFGAQSSVLLTPIWRDVSPPEPLSLIGVPHYFADDAHADRVLLLLDIGGGAETSAKAAARFGTLATDATLAAGADARFLYARSFPSTATAAELLAEFFASVQMPASVTDLSEDRVTVLEYGGYASLGASLGYGYEIKGTPSFEIGQMRLTESYAFSLLAQARIAAKIAGRFRISVRQGSQDGWARIDLHRATSSTLAIAADVKANADLQPVDFPVSTDELLEAIFGLRAKNFLHLLEEVRTYTDVGMLRTRLDTLAEGFIEEFVGAAFEELAAKTRFDELLTKATAVAQSYRDVGDHAVALFDRYFDPVTGAVDTKLEAMLDLVARETDWNRFKGDIDPTLWAVVNQLTGGDPLAFALKIAGPGGVKSLEEIQARARGALSLIRESSHAEIRQVIALARQRFPLDAFVTALADLDGPKLRGLTEKRLRGFVERLTGKVVDGLAASEVGRLATRVNEALGKLDEAKTVLHARIVETLTQSAEFELHRGYHQAGEGDALISVEVELAARDLLRAAAHGDFATVLSAVPSGMVQLRDGVLTNKLQEQSKLSVNAVGWHTEWVYDALDQLIVESEQRVFAEAGNQLTLLTTIEMQRTKDVRRGRERARERVYTNLVLRFLGESSGALRFDAQDKRYLIEAITGMASRYQLLFDDQSTTPAELAQYLSFADDFGLAPSDVAAEAALAPLLPRDPQGNLGSVTISYDVRFTEAGLKALLQRPVLASESGRIRRMMRLMVLANFVGSPELAGRAWVYWTPSAYEMWKEKGGGFANVARTFRNIAPSPLRNLQAARSVTLDTFNLRQLETLYRIEERVVRAFTRLSELLTGQDGVSPVAYEKALADFGSALKEFDSIDEGDNTIFAVFDHLIQSALPPGSGTHHRSSSLTLTSVVGGVTTTRVLFA